jgi:hypothetical protein
MAKISNKEPLTPLYLSPQEHSKMKEHSHLLPKSWLIFSPSSYIGPPEKTEVPLQ